ncbi:MAG: YebC/PmpR family DNA-binding transcriptional regulator [Bacillota bacterium]
MSGHSKFANIKHKKERNDAAKGKIFTMLGRELQVTVKAGGPDPSNNGKLRDLIAKCKSSNMPNDTIDRAIKKASGNEEGVEYESIRYEGYGPNGVAVLVDTLTDNRNRAAANVRNAFTKGGGNMGTSGCVSFMFDEKGLIVLDREEVAMDEEELMLFALDAGADDIVAEEDSFEILTTPEAFSGVREAFEKEKIPMVQAEVTMIPQTDATLSTPEDIKKMNKLLDLLDEDDDVQTVYHNWDE